MRYSRVLHAITSHPWAILPEKLEAIVELIELRAQGARLTQAQVQLRLEDDRAQPVIAPDDRASADDIGSYLIALEPQAGAPAPAPAQARSQELTLDPDMSPADVGSEKKSVLGVIPVRGVIAHRISIMEQQSGGTSAELIKRDVRAMAGDDRVRTILLDVDSPGGVDALIEELAQEIRAAGQRKRVVAVANTVMASAAYWLASGTTEIVASPSAQVGSIGIYGLHVDRSKQLDEQGLSVTYISAGKYKTEANETEPLSDDAIAHLQSMVDARYRAFVRDVAKGRRVSVRAVRSGFGEGRVVGAQTALDLGMVDRVDTLDNTLARELQQAAKADKASASARDSSRRSRRRQAQARTSQQSPLATRATRQERSRARVSKSVLDLLTTDPVI